MASRATSLTVHVHPFGAVHETMGGFVDDPSIGMARAIRLPLLRLKEVPKP